MSKVKDVMTGEVPCVSPSTHVFMVAHEMNASGGGIIVVCHNEKFLGVVTQRDVVGYVADALDPWRETAGTLMKNHHPVISPGDEILEAAKVMVNSGVHALPVVQGERLVGLLTIYNLAQESLPLAALVFANTHDPEASPKLVV